MQFMLLFSRQGKLRLQKWYVPLSDKEKKKITRELVQTVLARKPKMCSFLEWRDLKIVYKRLVWSVFVDTHAQVSVAHDGNAPAFVKFCLRKFCFPVKVLLLNTIKQVFVSNTLLFSQSFLKVKGDALALKSCQYHLQVRCHLFLLQHHSDDVML